MVLEYLDGAPSSASSTSTARSRPRASSTSPARPCNALGVAHDLGLIHRDVKPDNSCSLRVGADADYTKILDFASPSSAGRAAEQLALTAAGMVFGTPEFMSPEQACGQPSTAERPVLARRTMFVDAHAATAVRGPDRDSSGSPPRAHAGAAARDGCAPARPTPSFDDLPQRCLASPRSTGRATAHELAAMLARIERRCRRPPGAAPVDAPASSSGPGPGSPRADPARPAAARRRARSARSTGSN